MPTKMVDGKRTYIEHKEPDGRAGMPEHEATIQEVEAEFDVKIRMGRYARGVKNGKAIPYYQVTCGSPYGPSDGPATFAGGDTPQEALRNLRAKLEARRPL